MDAVILVALPRRIAGVVQEHDVGFGVFAENAVGRVAKVLNLVGFKIRELAAELTRPLS
jgi:hypothetical protein